MKLEQLIEKIEYTLIGGKTDVEIANLVYDSRKVSAGDVFVRISAAVSDGHAYIESAIEKGAIAIVTEKEVSLPENITVIKTEDNRVALAKMSAAYFDYPSQKLTTIGITGTKGKTTTTYMIKAVLERLGISTGVIGTSETVLGAKHLAAINTTPESYVIQETFAQMAEAGCRCVVMEVSSQGLMQHRVDGFTFNYGIFTNIEPDHIGKNEHKDFDEYLSCKRMLLKQCKTGIVNADDSHINEMLKGHTCELESYAIDKAADLRAEQIHFYREDGILGMKFLLSGCLNAEIAVDIPGRFSVYNALCAIALCRHFTEDVALIKQALADVKVKGRAEIVPVSKRFTLMIDYAHNAMSLESLLVSLRAYQPERLVVLFGCGGNRDRNRRFEMGEVASKMADLSIVTSDNPRDEEPMAIIEDILTGVHRADGEYVTIPDRKEAIRYAIRYAKDGDVIVLAGKGHEDYQIIKGVKYPMDERVIIGEIVKEPEIREIL